MLSSRAPLLFRAGWKRFALVETQYADSAPGRRLGRAEAEQVLRRSARDDEPGLRLAYAHWSHQRGSLADISSLTALQGMIGLLAGGQRGGRLVVKALDDGRAGATGAGDTTEQQRDQRVDRLIRDLGDGDLTHQGSAYRLVRSGARSKFGRDNFEVLQDRLAQQLVAAMADEPGRDDTARASLRALLELMPERVATPHQILLLRRERHFFKPEEEPATTPSQLRRRELHFVALEAVDADEKPVKGIQIEFVLASGETKPMTTDADGIARLEPVAAGTTTIRVLNLDGSSWHAAGAKPSAKGPASGRTHTVKQGECLSKIAHKYGVADWKKIWDDGQNRGLRDKRKSPNVLYPGDQLVIPPVKVHEIERSTDAVHRIKIVAEPPKLALSVTFRDCQGTAFEGEKYELSYEGLPEPKRGTLSGGGELSEQVPVGVRRADVYFPERDLRYTFSVGHLDPTEDPGDTTLLSGVAARLAALGHLRRAPADPRDLAAYREAVGAFQRSEMGKQEPTGDIDAETRSRLEAAYGV